MEKIKEALKKAKLEFGSSKTIKKTQVDSVPKKFYGKDVESLGSIVYEQTKVLKLNPATLEEYRIVAQNKHDPASWAFDSLRTQVLQKMEENHWRTLAIVSPTPAAGKTVVAINLAISIAQQPKKTAMLVDFDLRKPRVAKYLGIESKKSLNDLIAGEAELSEIILNPSIPRFTVITTNKAVSQSSEKLSSDIIQKLVIDLKEKYDSRIVIFDLPPLLNVDDAMVMLPQVDCVLFVLGDGLHTESEIRDSMRLLSRSNILGIVVNRADIELKSYY
jgi:protein-tyrosine kinase